ncbi:d2e48381-ef00-44f2-b72b-3f08d3d74d6b [Sclerotinia trifoliorum]|uniref:D2e48381-ef00-44f2-b72b-3f08d3d74d6b n=1 Tax=Sclerotinia trifoliorum TaxID=28548 RepID=A0A8H2VL53_9HELO|nr:d2e48381-ef00-44f2-b72b-3f08d3d74d6b [Sclerotinia trifoliorum]
MATSLAYRLALIVTFIAILYQSFFKRIIFDVAGYGRSVSTIDAFNATCERIDNLGLEACEDMWLHHATGYLYMACSDVQSRLQWLPAVDRLNASGRGLTDKIAILDTRGNGPLESRIQWMKTENFSGNNGDGTFNLHGFDIRQDAETDTLRILLVNHRIPIDPITGDSLDASILGANSTIELFHSNVGSDSMRHVRTYTDPAIQTPNRVAWVDDDAFVFTNDRSAKIGLRRHFDLLLGGGSIGYCDSTVNRCNVAYSSGISGPNGLVTGRDGLIYVPNTHIHEIQIFSFTERRTLLKLDTLQTPYLVDNMSVDENGDIIGASFPQVYKWAQSLNDRSVKAPTAAVRIRRKGADFERMMREGIRKGKDLGKSTDGYAVEILVEDDGTLLSAATTAIHDVRTGKLYLGGITTPFVMTCEMKV